MKSLRKALHWLYTGAVIMAAGCSSPDFLSREQAETILPAVTAELESRAAEFRSEMAKNAAAGAFVNGETLNFFAGMPDVLAERLAMLGINEVYVAYDGEFFADGTYRPIRRIIDLLSLTEEANFADSMAEQKKRPSNPEEKRKFMLGILHKAALMTLAKNSYEIALVRKYCMWAMENKDIPQGAKSEISPIIGEE